MIGLRKGISKITFFRERKIVSMSTAKKKRTDSSILKIETNEKIGLFDVFPRVYPTSNLTIHSNF